MTTGIMSAYKRLPISFEKGSGVWLYDSNGDAYIDGISGIGVSGNSSSSFCITKSTFLCFFIFAPFQCAEFHPLKTLPL